ncbi:hypothetical protein GCM10027074_63950 [Streptomyces deserti]
MVAASWCVSAPSRDSWDATWNPACNAPDCTTVSRSPFNRPRAPTRSVVSCGTPVPTLAGLAAPDPVPRRVAALLGPAPAVRRRPSGFASVGLARLDQYPFACPLPWGSVLTPSDTTTEKERDSRNG